MEDNGSATGQRASFVEAADRLAAELLVPTAEAVDRSEVPLEHVQRIAAAGLLAPTAPVELGGGGASPAVGRAVVEVLSGASGATWFVCTQHGSPVRTLQASDNTELRARLMRPLASGSTLAGIALAHLRRPGAPAVSGVAAPGGWSVSGDVAWLSSWGLAEIVMLGFRDGPDVVFALVPAAEAPGFVAGPLLALAAMQAARTVSVRLDAFFVSDADVAQRVPYDEWAERDAAMTANAAPAVFGLLRPVLARLRYEGERRREPATVALAARLESDTEALRSLAYALIDDAPAGTRMSERLAVRAAVLELVVTATSALVAAGAGASMSLGHPAQRWAREALFHLIQAQTSQVRVATMQRFLAGR
ncbi:acyl-CoA dehydrogenase family protein [Acidothermaceae bacterium B102]|nr:acyl-CoA dehydrogenase family protein [Acidothermaceae bacterium B102]